MQTNELIERMATDLRPLPRRGQLLAIALAVGGVIALVAAWLALGLRPGLLQAMHSVSFWMKWGFTLITATVAFILCARLARPESGPGWWPVALVVTLFAMVAAACAQVASAPSVARRMMWFGHSAIQCPWCITLFSIPLFVGILWAYRYFAPTRPRLAGFSAGLLAGSTAAVIYALSCDETSAAFVATWYTAGMLIPALIGAVIGPRVLRW